MLTFCDDLISSAFFFFLMLMSLIDHIDAAMVHVAPRLMRRFFFTRGHRRDVFRCRCFVTRALYDYAIADVYLLLLDG